MRLDSHTYTSLQPYVYVYTAIRTCLYSHTYVHVHTAIRTCQGTNHVRMALATILADKRIWVSIPSIKVAMEDYKTSEAC